MLSKTTRGLIGTLTTCLLVWHTGAIAGRLTHTPYTPQKVVFDFYFNAPEAIGAGLYWVRGLLNPLSEHPYDYAPDDHRVVIVLHGVEVVTLAKHNYEQYRDAVERMRYYSELGVSFRVCALSLQEFNYRPEDLHDFVDIVPSAFAELAHWQQRGYALIQPQILEKIYATEQIR